MNILHKIIPYFIIVAVLSSSLGYTANKMVCLKSGKTKLSFLHINDCCPKKETNSSTIKSNCCDIVNSSFSLEKYTVTENVNLSELAVYTLPVDLFLFSAEAPSNNSLRLTPTHKSSSPLFGRKLLSIISILII